MAKQALATFRATGVTDASETSHYLAK